MDKLPSADASPRAKMPSRPREFHPEPLTDPDLNLSIHPARVTARRLPPSAEPSGSSRFDPVGPRSTTMTYPLRSIGITPLRRYYEAVRPSPAHRYFQPHGWSRLCFFPLASPARFSRSIQEPGRESRHLHAGCRLGSLRHPPSLSRRLGQPSVLTSSKQLSTLLQWFAYARLSRPCLTGSCPDFSATFTTMAFDHSSLRWFEINT